MRPAILFAALLLAAQNLAIADEPASWKGVTVLPKLGAVVSVGIEKVDADKFSLPWIIRNVSGDRFLVGDRPKGWVHRSQVINLGEASDYYSRLIANDEKTAWAYACRAIANQHQGNLDQAIADYTESLRLEPRASTYANRGYAWIHKREAEKAIADFDQAIELDPNYAAAYRRRGNLRHSKHDYDAAIADYDQAIRLDPDNVDAYCERAAALSTRHEYERAIADCDQAIRLDPNAARAYRIRRSSWIDNGDFDKAIADCDEAIEVDPDDTEAYFVRGIAWSKKQDFDKAIADYDQVVRIDPAREGAYINRGLAWQQKQEYEKAVADYEQAIKTSPGQAIGYNNLAWLRATCPVDRLRNGQQAVKLAIAACEISQWKDANICGTLAGAYAEAGDFESAIKYETQAIEMNPTDAEYVKPAKERLALYQEHKPYREK